MARQKGKRRGNSAKQSNRPIRAGKRRKPIINHNPGSLPSIQPPKHDPQSSFNLDLSRRRINASGKGRGGIGAMVVLMILLAALAALAALAMVGRAQGLW